MQCELINTIRYTFDGFNQFSQIIFSFALGLAFSQSNITVGWIFFWIIVWEFGVFVIFANTQYYDPFFRIAYNCVFLLSILVGQYIYFGKTTFQDFLYPNSVHTKKAYTGTKYKILDTFESYINDALIKEEERDKKKKLKKKYKFFFS